MIESQGIANIAKRKFSSDQPQPAPGFTSACGAGLGQSEGASQSPPVAKRARVAISDAEHHSSDPPEGTVPISALMHIDSDPVNPTNNGDWLWSLCRHHVSGGILDALMVQSEPEGGYWVRSFAKSSGAGSAPFSVNAMRRVHGGWRSCNVRKSGKTVHTRGVLSVWRKEDIFMVAYRDANAVIRWIDEQGPAVSNLTRNRLMHALNGNILYWSFNIDSEDVRVQAAQGVYLNSVYSNYARMMATGDMYGVGPWDAWIMDDHPPPGPSAPWIEQRSLGPDGLGAGSGHQADGPASSWFISNADRNRAMHALNGNSAKGGAKADGTKKKATREDKRREEFDKKYRTVHSTPSCKLCSKTFKVYEREHLKLKNSKSIGKDYGLDMCHACRAWVAEQARQDNMGIEPADDSDGVPDLVESSSEDEVDAEALSPIQAMPAVKAATTKTQPKQPPAVKEQKEYKEAETKKPDGDGPSVRACAFDTAFNKLLPTIREQSGSELYSTHGARGYGLQGQGGTPVVLLAGSFDTLLEACEVFVVTKLFPNYDGVIAGIPYTMTSDFGHVVIDGVVWKQHNWLYDGGIEGRCSCVKVASVDCGGEVLDCFKVWKDPDAMVVKTIYHGSYQTDVDRYAWYEGKDRTTMFRNGVRSDMRRAVWQQADRFFSGTTAAAVCGTNINGALKANEELTGEAIDCATNILSWKLEGRAAGNAKARVGDRKTWQQTADLINGVSRERSWWIPDCIWWAMDPYARAWTQSGRGYYSMFVTVVALIAVFWLIQGGGLVPTMGKMERTLIGGSPLFDHILRTGEHAARGSLNATSWAANATFGAASEAYREYRRIHVPNRSAYFYARHGRIQDLLRYRLLNDSAAGDRMARALDGREGLDVEFYNFLIGLVTLTSAFKAFVCYVWPFVEEYVTHYGLKVPVLLPAFVPERYFGELNIDVLLHQYPRLWPSFLRGEMCDAVFGGLRQSWVDSWFWASRWRLGQQVARVHWIDSQIVCLLLVMGLECCLSSSWIQVMATVFVHWYCYVSSYGHAVLMHIVYNASLWITGCMVLPYASVVMCGRYAVSAVVAAGLRAYFRGATDGRFPRVEPMGKDTQFQAYAETPSCDDKFPLKEGTKEDLKVGHGRTKGKNRLTVLLSVFVLAASFAANTGNVLHSVYGRVLAAVPECKGSTDKIVGKLDKISAKMGRVEPDDPVEWASKFPKRKKNRYLQALTLFAVVGYAAFDDVLLGGKNRWDQRSCFLKHETNLTQLDKYVVHNGTVYVISCADPRTIQASEDIVQAVAGPYFTAYGRRAAAVFDGGENSMIGGWRVCMAYGRTKSETARIIQRIQNSPDNGVVDCGDDVFIVWDTKCYAIDAKRWDAHVSATLLRLKARHLLALGMPKEIVNMLDRLIKRKGSYKGLGVRFALEGDVASGDPDTLYWNTTLGVALVLAAVDGATTFEEFSANCVAWGIEYELAAVGSRTEPEANLDFCSCVFVPTKDGWTLAPKIGRAWLKAAHTANSGNPAVLLASKIMGLSYDLAAYPDVVTILRMHLPDLPCNVEANQAYVPMGKVDPASYEELDEFVRRRYGMTYADLLDDMHTCIVRSRQGQMASGDLVHLLKCISVDYGKQALPGPMPPTSSPRVPYVRATATRPVARGWSRTKLLSMLLLVGRVGLNLISREALSGVLTYGRRPNGKEEGWWTAARTERPWWAGPERQHQGKGQRSAWQGRLFNRESSGARGQDDPEGDICKGRGEAGPHGWPGAGEYYGSGGLCVQRYSTHTLSSVAQHQHCAADFECGVCDGHNCRGRSWIQRQGVDAKSLRERGVSMDAQARHAVHEVPHGAAGVRVPLEHVGLCSVRPAWHDHHGASLQCGCADVREQAADGGRDARSVGEALEQHHVRRRVRSEGRLDQMAMGARGRSESNESDRSLQVLVRDLRSPGGGWNSTVAGGVVGPLHGGSSGARHHGRQSVGQRSVHDHAHLEQHAWAVCSGVGGHRGRWVRTAGWEAGVRRGRALHPNTDEFHRAANSTVFRVDRQGKCVELVVWTPGNLSSDGGSQLNSNGGSERFGANVPGTDYLWQWIGDGGGPCGLSSIVAFGGQSQPVGGSCEHTGRESYVQCVAELHQSGDSGTERKHIGRQQRHGQGGGLVSVVFDDGG